MLRTEPVSAETLADWAALRFALWPEEGLIEEAADWLATGDPNQHNVVARVDGGRVIGFAEATLRHDYVNGASTSPVVFLEGIYVSPYYRGRGAAAALVEAIADWGRAQGCTEFASDALLDNVDSQAFHRAIGFAEQERVVCFCKPL